MHAWLNVRAKEEDIELNRKIALVTEGFSTTNKYCRLVLSDRNRLSKENALTVCDYMIAMKREINPRLTTISTTIQFLSGLSKFAVVEKRFEDMRTTRKILLSYLDSCRKQSKLLVKPNIFYSSFFTYEFLL